MPQAIVVRQVGGPEVMSLVDIEVGDPGPGEVRLRQEAVGVNFIDVYYRQGLYKPAAYPFTPGMEGAGVVDAVGPGVTEFRVGQRVAYPMTIGAYASFRLIPVAKLVPLPDTVTFDDAAAIMLKGLTAQYLLRQTVPLVAGDAILFHAASGGVGHLACQWAHHLGITVIATAGGEAKVARARAAGATHVIDYAAEDFVTRVKELTGGAGVRAVFDSVGRDTFSRSLDCLRPFGTMVSFGQSSGNVPPFDILTLSAKGSLHLTRPTLGTYVADRGRLTAMARELFDVIAAGVVKADVRQRYPLADAARAHAALEGRETSGASVLIP
jgi:NADPH2:quinone reductase